MKANQRKWWPTNVAAALLAAVMVLAPTAPAMAEISDVSGVDHWYLTGEDNEATEAHGEGIDVLAVVGQEGDAVYVNVDRNGHPIASHLPYQLGNAEQDENGQFVGVMNINMNKSFDANSKYTISVYRDYEETDLVYQGQISTVYGIFCSDANSTQGEKVAIMLRTMGKSDPRSMPETVVYEGNAYKHDGEIDGIYRYVLQGQIADTLEGSIKYYDVRSGETIKEDPFTISKEEGTKELHVDSIVTLQAGDGNHYYRSMQLTDSVTARYPGQTSFSIPCAELDNQWGAGGQPYMARFKYVDVAGGELNDSIGLLDKLTVTKEYSYVPPELLFIKNGDQVEYWQLVTGAGQTAPMDEDNAIVLSPSADGEGLTPDGYKDISIAYKKLDETANARWTVRLENGTVGMGQPGRLLQSSQIVVEPKGVGTFDVPEYLMGTDSDGNTVRLVPVAGTDKTLTYKWDAHDLLPTSTVYYVPEGYEANEAYDVTVRLVNIADNSVIREVTRQMTPDYITNRAYLEFPADEYFPATFTEGSTNYVRLDGQGETISHNYYNYDVDENGNKSKVYVIYYRDANDNTHKDTVVRTVRVVYDDDLDNGTTNNGTTTTNNGTTTKDNGTTNQGTTAKTTNVIEEEVVERAVIRLGDDSGDTMRSITTGGNEAAAALVNNSGESMADRVTEFLGGNDNPLANMAGQAVATVENMNPLARLATTGVVLAAIAGLLWWFFFIFKKRKDEEKEQQASTTNSNGNQ